MAIENRLVTCGTVATQVVGADNMPHEVHLHNMTKSSNEYIFIGGSSAVSTANTLHLDPGESITLNLRPDDEIWAVSDPDGLELGVLDIRRND